MKGKIPVVCGSRRDHDDVIFRPHKTSKNIAYLISYDYESGKDNENAY